LAEIAEALGPNIEKTKAALAERERESKEIAKRHAASFRDSRVRASVQKFLKGPLGWITAAFLLILLIAK
jgi:hypothetical protein